MRAIAARLGQHEAAHYVAARVLGFQAGDIKVQLSDLYGARQGASALTPSEPLRSIPEIISFLRRRIQVLYAGVLGESLTNAGEIDNEAALSLLRGAQGQDDYNKASQLIRLLRNIAFPDDSSEVIVQEHLTLLDRELWNAAADLVHEDQRMIRSLGGRLASELTKVGIGTWVSLSAEELEGLPSIAARFSSPEPR